MRSARSYNAGEVIYDLHSHSNASDGAMHPSALLQYAAECGVDALAITDHDTLDAFDRIHSPAAGVQLITGIELSTSWRRIGVHVVGLDIDPANAILRRGVAAQQQARHERVRLIARRLQTAGLPDLLDATLELAAGGWVGRPHFAGQLVAAGIVKDTRTAFRKYLGAGKAGDVRCHWAPLEAVVAWINAAGGIAVLAHPARYRLTRTRLRALATDFRNAGGRAIEVVCGTQQDGNTAALARLAADLGLAASCGSDFHDPSLSWSRPGRYSPLPSGLQPVWKTWTTRCK